MGDNIFNYILEITGQDNRIHSDVNGKTVPYMEFKETNYFSTLGEAVESLLLTDIRKFERQSGETDNDRYYEHAAIRKIEDKESLLEIMRFSFEDTPEGIPAAGIYMRFCDSTTEKFEQLANYDLSGFSAYYPTSSFLQLASYAYDKGFKIYVDEDLTDRINNLDSYEQSLIYDDVWSFKVGITRNRIDLPSLQEICNYHYPSLQEAFVHLLDTEITDMDRDVAEGLNKKSWINDAYLRERGTIKLVELIAVKDAASGETVAEPGIHLKFHTSIADIEGESGIGLAQLGHYGQDNKYLLVANYYKDFGKLLPHPGYLSLLASVNAEKTLRQPQGEQVPYQLRITWVSTQNLNGSINYPQQQVTQIACTSFEEALFSMKKLGEHSFDERRAFYLRSPFYVKQADIIDAENNTTVISKFHVREDNKQIPSGIYIKVNEGYVSVEMLKLLRTHMGEDIQSETAQFLFTKGETQQYSSYNKPKKTNRSQRTRIPPDSKGLSL